MWQKPQEKMSWKTTNFGAKYQLGLKAIQIGFYLSYNSISLFSNKHIYPISEAI